MFLDKIVWDCCLWSTYCVRACTNELAENFDRATFMMVAIYTGVGNDEGKDTVGQWQVAGGLTGLGLYFDIAEGLNKLFPLDTQPVVSEVEVANDDIENYVEETFGQEKKVAVNKTTWVIIGLVTTRNLRN